MFVSSAVHDNVLWSRKWHCNDIIPRVILGWNPTSLIFCEQVAGYNTQPLGLSTWKLNFLQVNNGYWTIKGLNGCILVDETFYKTWTCLRILEVKTDGLIQGINFRSSWCQTMQSEHFGLETTSFRSVMYWRMFRGSHSRIVLQVSCCSKKVGFSIHVELVTM